MAVSQLKQEFSLLLLTFSVFINKIDKSIFCTVCTCNLPYVHSNEVIYLVYNIYIVTVLYKALELCGYYKLRFYIRSVNILNGLKV